MRRSNQMRCVICGVAFAACLVVALGFALKMAISKERREPLPAPGAKLHDGPDGKELFTREWKPNDARSHSGDGLGPMFNARSCVACHSQGAIGGGGPASKNVHILTRFVDKRAGMKGFELGLQSVVLHHFGTDSEYQKWRENTAESARMVPGGSHLRHDRPLFLFSGRQPQITQRNTPALFGLGMIDKISERTLEEAAAKRYTDFPKVTGRVARDSNGVGRFGWKGQKSSLEDFVLTACAVEVGLQVSGHQQPPMPHKPDDKSAGLDMNKAECDALVDYVRSLPAPTRRKPSHAPLAEFVNTGEQLFATVGCAACHTPKLGYVAGIYSDLLLHDMGRGLSDAGSSYGVLRPTAPPKSPKPPKDEGVAKNGKPKKPAVATAQEWRTPPLWGVGDSAPYLHDGRAKTLEKAIAFHAGEATDSTKKFNALSAADKQKLIAFLKSLVAPSPKGS